MMGRMTVLRRALGLSLLALAPVSASLAQAPSAGAAPPAAAASTPAQSALTAELFYQLLVGELAARNQDPGSAFQLMLDAARRTRDPVLFQRAADIALQARSGESALQAAQAWRQAHPDSREAGKACFQARAACRADSPARACSAMSTARW